MTQLAATQSATSNAVQSNSAHYGLLRRVPLSYADAVQKVTATLKEQGFGILTEIDVQATLKKKLDKDFTKYIILGACNPPLAFRALSAELDIGLLLPCNVCVYEDPKTHETVLSAVDPNTLVDLPRRKDVAPLAAEGRTKLRAALAAV
jgi:uncharacterized protein (DUF302 family)